MITDSKYEIHTKDKRIIKVDSALEAKATNDNAGDIEKIVFNGKVVWPV